MILTSRTIRQAETGIAIMKIIIIIAAATAIIATSAGAETVRSQVAVSYADLNLASPAGQATLAHRVAVAADRACHVDSNERHLRSRQLARDCRHAAVAKASLIIASATAPQYASR